LSRKGLRIEGGDCRQVKTLGKRGVKSGKSGIVKKKVYVRQGSGGPWEREGGLFGKRMKRGWGSEGKKSQDAKKRVQTVGTRNWSKTKAQD